MYTIKIENGTAILYKDNIAYTPQKENTTVDFLLEYYYSNSLVSQNFLEKDLDKLLEEILNTDIINYKVFLRPYGALEDPLLKNKNREQILVIKTDNKKLQRFVIKYEIEKYIENKGYADTRYINYYMPKWSTAYKFYASNHSKVLQPFHDNLRYFANYFKNSFYKESESNVNNPERYQIPFTPDNVDVITSKNIINSLVSTKLDLFNQSKLYFGHKYNKIHIYDRNFIDLYTLKIQGTYKNQFIEETITIESKSVYTLKYNYTEIYNIIIMPDNLNNFNPLNFDLMIGNYLRLEKFMYELRLNTNLELEDNNIILSDEVLEPLKVFYLDTNTYDKLFITSDDKVISIKNNKLYTAKLDSKIHLNFPKNITYNNNKFIETTYVYDDTYNIKLYLKDYMIYAENRLVSVYLENSKGEKLYLNNYLNLVESVEELFMTDFIAAKDDYVELEIKIEDSEYITINIQDYENKYLISDIIIHPHIDLIEEYEIPTDAAYEIILIDKIPYLYNSTYLKRLLSQETRSKDLLWLDSLNDTSAYNYIEFNTPEISLTHADSLVTNLNTIHFNSTQTKNISTAGPVNWKILGILSDKTPFMYEWFNDNSLVIGDDNNTIISYKALAKLSVSDVFRISIPKKYYDININLTEAISFKINGNYVEYVNKSGTTNFELKTKRIFEYRSGQDLDYFQIMIKRNKDNTVTLIDDSGAETLINDGLLSTELIDNGVLTTLEVEVIKKDINQLNYPVILKKVYSSTYPFEYAKDIYCIGTPFISKTLDRSLLTLTDDEDCYAIVGKVKIDGIAQYIYGVVPASLQANLSAADLTNYVFLQTYKTYAKKELINWVGKVMFLSDDFNNLIISPSNGIVMDFENNGITWDPVWNGAFSKGFDIKDGEFNLEIDKLPSKERNNIRKKLSNISQNEFNLNFKNIKKYINLTDLVNNGEIVEVKGCMLAQSKVPIVPTSIEDDYVYDGYNSPEPLPKTPVLTNPEVK